VADNIFGIYIVRCLELGSLTIQIVDQPLATDEYPVGQVLLGIVRVDVPEQIDQAFVVVLLYILLFLGKPNREFIDEIYVGEDQFVE
jgi:hypothetical protein